MKDSIRPAKLADTIAEHLEQLIVEGSLRPGEKLVPERELAVRFNVSRPSLREALEKLEQRGLLRSGRGGATFVAPLLGPTFTEPLHAVLAARPETTLDYLEFRTEVEGAAAYYAALRATDVDRAQIQARFEAMEAAHGHDEAPESAKQEADADAEFHLAVYEATHNVVILHIMRALAEMLRQDVFFNRAKLYQRTGVRQLLLSQHRALYEAIMKGDPAAARAAAEAHINFIRDALVEISRADARLEASLRRIAGGDIVAEK
ncbi:Pyruvate dehydrogenase complex repressor [Nitrospirillum viridazoti Y2]|uniref:Pyruvate dehydrogenase complex repressor n=1 Tax=Nitrospirillum amazonense TaxID=28077 RepID=A0A560IHQ8_9PROT|nr:FCD domain-containing protein [Nitrospirillum amazonense]EGY00032.1 Pyruvate dehydrogenase complex repressor [Nitrospirillum amazonense Y2]TWB56330.1 GntR family transcriptional regulator [Nitrospirillum amazonense]